MGDEDEPGIKDNNLGSLSFRRSPWSSASFKESIPVKIKAAGFLPPNTTGWYQISMSLIWISYFLPDHVPLIPLV